MKGKSLTLGSLQLCLYPVSLMFQSRMDNSACLGLCGSIGVYTSAAYHGISPSTWLLSAGPGFVSRQHDLLVKKNILLHMAYSKAVSRSSAVTISAILTVG